MEHGPPKLPWKYSACWSKHFGTYRAGNYIGCAKYESNKICAQLPGNSIESRLMSGSVTRLDTAAAAMDLKLRTLEGIGYDFGRLLYLASTRDLSTAEYHHYGLARAFSEYAAREALVACHTEVFLRIATCPLESLIPQIERFLRTGSRDIEKAIDTWESLEAYRLCVPPGCDRLSLELFVSNVRIAMRFLRSRLNSREPRAQSASPPLLLGQ